MTTPAGGIGGLPPTGPTLCPAPDCIPAGEVQFTPAQVSAFTDAYPDLEGRDGGGVYQAWLTQGTDCGPLGVAYWCDSDVLVLYGPLPQYDGSVPNPSYIELITDTGVFSNVPLQDHVSGFASHPEWQAVRIHDASQYGTEVQSIAFFNQDGTRTCTLLKPYGTWNGAPWKIGTGNVGCTPTPLNPTPPDPQVATVTYDPTGQGEIDITVPGDPIFLQTTTYVIDIDNGSYGPFDSNVSPDFEVVDGNHVRFNVSTILGTDPFVMHHITITDPDGNVLATWDGSIAVNQ